MNGWLLLLILLIGTSTCNLFTGTGTKGYNRIRLGVGLVLNLKNDSIMLYPL